jgi:hypothetical protein
MMLALDTRSTFFLYPINNKMKKDAKNILYHTIGMASTEINAPKTAVNPHMKTIKCKCK